jgi:hypothetical protein
MQGNWCQTSWGDFDERKLYSCRHVNAVVAWVNHKVIPEEEKPDDRSPTYAEDISRLLTTYLVNNPEPATPGNWILGDVTYPFKSGNLVFYLSEYEGIFVFCRTKSTSGRNYLHCFLCPRSRSCSHISLAPSVERV